MLGNAASWQKRSECDDFSKDFRRNSASIGNYRSNRGWKISKVSFWVSTFQIISVFVVEMERIELFLKRKVSLFFWRFKINFQFLYFPIKINFNSVYPEVGRKLEIAEIITSMLQSRNILLKYLMINLSKVLMAGLFVVVVVRRIIQLFLFLRFKMHRLIVVLILYTIVLMEDIFTMLVIFLYFNGLIFYYLIFP